MPIYTGTFSSLASNRPCSRVRRVRGLEPISEYLYRISSTADSGIGLPPVTLLRYSGISSRVSGVPCASSSTAARSPTPYLQRQLPHKANHVLDVLYRSAWHNPVPEVK